MTLPLYLSGRDRSMIRNPHSGFTLGPAPSARHQGIHPDNMFCLSCPPANLSLKDAMALKPRLCKPVSNQ